MITFLPFESFVESARCLDYKRLGKQRVEVRDVLRIIDGKFVGRFNRWNNHPVILMWQNHREWLRMYHDAIIEEWVRRGYRNNLSLLAEGIVLDYSSQPRWLGDARFHDSHKSNLLRKNYEHYSRFGWRVRSDLSYYWPGDNTDETKVQQVCQSA